MKAQYKLTLTFSFEAFDNIDARQKTMEFLNELGVDLEELGAEKKLQKVFDNKPPEKVEL